MEKAVLFCTKLLVLVTAAMVICSCLEVVMRLKVVSRVFRLRLCWITVPSAVSTKKLKPVTGSLQGYII